VTLLLPGHVIFDQFNENHETSRFDVKLDVDSGGQALMAADCTRQSAAEKD